jgi:hypothetical protein
VHETVRLEVPHDDDTERSRYAVRLTANVELLQASQSTEGAEDSGEMLQIKVSGLRKALRLREWRLQHEVLTEKRWQLLGYAFVHKKFERPALEDVSGLRLTEILSTFGSDIDRTCLLSAAERAHVVFTKQGALDRMREVLHVQVKQPSREEKKRLLLREGGHASWLQGGVRWLRSRGVCRRTLHHLVVWFRP